MQKNKKPGNGIGIVKENRPMKSTNMTGKRNQNKKSIILEKNAEKLSGKVVRLATRDEIDLQVAEHLIVELYSK